METGNMADEPRAWCMPTHLNRLVLCRVRRFQRVLNVRRSTVVKSHNLSKLNPLMEWWDGGIRWWGFSNLVRWFSRELSVIWSVTRFLLSVVFITVLSSRNNAVYYLFSNLKFHWENLLWRKLEYSCLNELHWVFYDETDLFWKVGWYFVVFIAKCAANQVWNIQEIQRTAIWLLIKEEEGQEMFRCGDLLWSLAFVFKLILQLMFTLMWWRVVERYLWM